MCIGASPGWDISERDDYCECGNKVSDGKDDYSYYVRNLMLHWVVIPVKERCPECKKK